MLAQLGVDPESEPRARRLVLRLAREVAAGQLDAAALAGYQANVRAQVAALRDDRAAWMGWSLLRTTLGLDPDARAWAHAVDRVTPVQVRRVGRRLGLEVSYALLPRGAARGPR